MVQSINTKGLMTLASVVRRPYLLSPQVHVANISELNYTALRDNCGIRAVVFDKDNTLTAPYETVIHPLAAEGLAHALRVFGHDHVAILSNSAGTKDDKEYKDAIEIEQAMGLAVIRHDEKKPGGLQEVLNHFGDLDDPSQLCMVGDRLLTDIVFGNLHGMLTVHTLPLLTGKDNARDNKIASWIRSTENSFLYGNWFLGRAVLSRTIPHKTWAGAEVCPLILEAPPTPAPTEEESKQEEEKREES